MTNGTLILMQSNKCVMEKTRLLFMKYGEIVFWFN